jgi:hypothetical protein
VRRRCATEISSRARRREADGTSTDEQASLRPEGRCDEAIPELETVIASNRNSPGALFALGHCKLTIGSIDEAIPLEEQAIRLGPRDPYVFNRYLVIGEVHLLQSRAEEAIVWLEKARIGNPGSPWPHALARLRLWPQRRFGSCRRRTCRGPQAVGRQGVPQHCCDEARQLGGARYPRATRSYFFRGSAQGRSASSSNHARPRAIALISAGSHLELCFCGANPGRTNLVSAPRRVNAAAAVSSTALSLAASDADDATSSPNRRPRRSLMVIVFSSTMIFSTSSRTSFPRRRETGCRSVDGGSIRGHNPAHLPRPKYFRKRRRPREVDQRSSKEDRNYRPAKQTSRDSLFSRLGA